MRPHGPAMLLRLLLVAATLLTPAASAPRPGLSSAVPVLSFFSALAARNRVYRTAEEFIADRNAYYNHLRQTARGQLARGAISTLRPSQMAAHVKLVTAIERDRAGTLALAEALKKHARHEFQHRLQDAITSALLGSGPAQRLVGALKNGIHSAQDAISSALTSLSGGGSGALADMARIRAVAERVNLVASNIGGPSGAALRSAADRILSVTNSLQLVEGDLRRVSAELDGLSENVSRIEQVQQVATGSVTKRDVRIFALTGETDNPVLGAILGLLSRQSTDASNLRQTARAQIEQGVVIRCVAKSSQILEALAKLEGGSPANPDQASRACQSLERSAASVAATAAAAAAATAAAKAATASAATATESARQTEEAKPPPLTDFSGAWHSAATCDEAEDAPYRWTVNLQQAADGQVTGRITFHKCPGGGRVEYAVSGQATSADALTLEGQRDSGRGGLGSSAPGNVTFSLIKGGAPDPNYAP